MNKDRYIKALQLYIEYINLCVPEREFESYTLEEQNENLSVFLSDFDYCHLEKYKKVLLEELASCGDSWTLEEFQSFNRLFQEFNKFDD